MNDDTQPEPVEPTIAEGDGIPREGIEVPADGETHETVLGDAAADPAAPLADVEPEPVVIGASIEDAAPVAPVEEEAPAPGPVIEAEPEQIAPVPEVVEPESAEAPEPVVVPLAFEDPIPSKDGRDTSTGLVWDIRDDNRPSVIWAKADLAVRAAAAAPYLELLATAKSFEPHAVLHTPFAMFAIDEHTGKSLMASLTDGTELRTLVRVDEIHRIVASGVLHAGYTRHEVATSMVMPLSSVLGLEPWPVEKPDVDALNLAIANAAS